MKVIAQRSSAVGRDRTRRTISVNVFLLLRERGCDRRVDRRIGEDVRQPSRVERRWITCKKRRADIAQGEGAAMEMFLPGNTMSGNVN